ncbi:hypothetical protein GCM10009566_42870 [Streptomyces murinus]
MNAWQADQYKDAPPTRNDRPMGGWLVWSIPPWPRHSRHGMFMLVKGRKGELWQSGVKATPAGTASGMS